ncbi:MAG: hypothetical protein Q8P61_02005 [Candidatus Nanopelagicales bacterium]|nr:hypothetical protein [Candidatus Nanopelagicales bacterium]
MTDGIRGEAFVYSGYDIDASAAVASMHYQVGGHEFTEWVRIPGMTQWNSHVVGRAVEILYLLAGVSYYKTHAPSTIRLGDTTTTSREREILRQYYLEGLGEFAARNNLSLDGLEIVGPETATPRATLPESPNATDPTNPDNHSNRRPLIPFGGGIDSIVTVEHVRRRFPDASLFVVNRPDDRFEAIEASAAVTGLPILRAERAIDPKLFESQRRGWLDGHVPVTGIVSAIAVLAAVLGGRTDVVMSNEASASVPTRSVNGREVNHQYSKSADFEVLFRELLAEHIGPIPAYFSWLRDMSELWVAREFSQLSAYWDSFRSCNRSFRLDRRQRLDHWCGECDKCCFIDLILSPFMAAADLRAIFRGNEPLDNPDLADSFRRLVGTYPGQKPWECVGDELECRAAVTLAVRRPDRAANAVLRQLTREAPPVDEETIESLLNPKTNSYRPDGYALDSVLG